jgi:hypothetical protein
MTVAPAPAKIRVSVAVMGAFTVSVVPAAGWSCPPAINERVTFKGMV